MYFTLICYSHFFSLSLFFSHSFSYFFLLSFLTIFDNFLYSYLLHTHTPYFNFITMHKLQICMCANTLCSHEYAENIQFDKNAQGLRIYVISTLFRNSFFYVMYTNVHMYEEWLILKYTCIIYGTIYIFCFSYTFYNIAIHTQKNVLMVFST